MLFNRENSRHIDTNDAKEVLAYIYGDLKTDFELDITVKEKPVLSVNDLLLLLNYHWARDTSTFPTERHRVQFVLILLLLFATGCRPAELVDAKKRKRRSRGLDDDDTCVDVDDEGFDDAKDGVDADFGFDDDHDSAVADLGSEDDDNSSDDVAMSDVETELRQFDFEWINKPGLPLSAKYIVQEPTLNLHSTTVAWLNQLMENMNAWIDGRYILVTMKIRTLVILGLNSALLL